MAPRPARSLVHRGHHLHLGTGRTATRADGGALPRRQLAAPADGARRGQPYQRGSPPPHELVPLPRTGLAPVPALPEPAGHDRRGDRHGGRPRRGLSLVPIPVARLVAVGRLLVRPPVRPRSLDRGRRGGRRSLPLLVGRHRLRDEGLRVGGLRRVDPAVGVVDPSTGLGLHLSLAPVVARHLPRRPVHHAHGRPALRDRLPRLRPSGRVALPDSVGPPASVAASHRHRCVGAGRLGLGGLPGAGPIPLGGAQPDPQRRSPGERLRRPQGPVVVDQWSALRLRAPRSRRHGPRRRGPDRLHRTVAHVRRRPGHRDHLGGHTPHDVRPGHLGLRLRHRAGEQRHLHPSLRDGRAALRPSAGRSGHRRHRAIRAQRSGATASGETGAAGPRTRRAMVWWSACASPRC